MGLFRDPKSVRRLQERMDELCESMDETRRHSRTLRLEWEETYDKIHRLFGRIAKRQAIDTPPLGPPMVEPDAGETGIDEISAAILRRRQKG